nr:ABATE domain-containing protein [Brevibacillus sp. SYP-B805]
MLCIDFLNSDWRDWRGSGRREDRLLKPEWWERFCEQWGLEAQYPPDADTLSALQNLRAHMRAVVEAVAAERPPERKDLDALNRALEHALSHPRLAVTADGFRLEQVVFAKGWPDVIGRIAESFARLLAEEDLRRLKICDNDDCRWVFFDESRNRVRRWCDDKMCGNLLKVRRFRERQKAKGTSV